MDDVAFRRIWRRSDDLERSSRAPFQLSSHGKSTREALGLLFYTYMLRWFDVFQEGALRVPGSGQVQEPARVPQCGPSHAHTLKRAITYVKKIVRLGEGTAWTGSGCDDGLGWVIGGRCDGDATAHTTEPQTARHGRGAKTKPPPIPPTARPRRTPRKGQSEISLEKVCLFSILVIMFLTYSATVTCGY